MTIGPGKYDGLCTLVRESVGLGGPVLTSGGGVAVIVVGGDQGNGFSCQADLETTLGLPDMLEDVARQMRALMNDEPDTESAALEADAVVELIRPLLAHRDPGVVGAVLAQLGAIFLASHAPSLRATARRDLLGLMDGLVAPTIEEMIEAGKFGAEWRYEQ